MVICTLPSNKWFLINITTKRSCTKTDITNRMYPILLYLYIYTILNFDTHLKVRVSYMWIEVKHQLSLYKTIYFTKNLNNALRRFLRAMTTNTVITIILINFEIFLQKYWSINSILKYFTELAGLYEILDKFLMLYVTYMLLNLLTLFLFVTSVLCRWYKSILRHKMWYGIQISSTGKE